MPPLVVGLGNACLDTVLALERLPLAGDKLPLLSQRDLVGGQVAGAMAGCARLGLATRFLLRTGDDEAGGVIRSRLAEAGIGLDLARVIPGAHSARALILREPQGERIVLWDTPAELAVLETEITADVLDGAAALFFDGRDGAACLAAARLARNRGIPVVADLDHHYPHTPALLPWIDHLVSPASFGHAHGPATVVVTRGAAGCEAWEGDRHLHVPAFSVPVVDTTGAGDAFHAAYIYALLQGWPLPRRLKFANAAAGLACGALGSLAGMPTLDRIEALVARSAPV